MNGAKAKRLRRAAEVATIGDPWIEYHKYTLPIYKLIEDTGMYMKVKGGVPCRLTRTCGRKIYQTMKNVKS